MFPALRVADTRASDEAELREPDEPRRCGGCASQLAGLEPRAAADALREQLESARTNAELLEKI